MKTLLMRSLLAALVLPSSVSVVAADEEGMVEEVVVSATRRDVPIMDIPQSIQAISSETLELPSFNNMNQVFNLVPGATGFVAKSPQTEGIQMRGSGITQSSASDGSSPVGYYVDDIPYMDISTPIPPPIGTFDLASVEVIRGPQGTSYGQDSAGGSIIMRTSPVDLENFGYKARLGETSVRDVEGFGYQAGGVVNVPIVKDTFGVRMSYQREKDTGFGSVDTRPDIENPLEYTRDSLRIKALFNVSENLSLEASHSSWDTTYGFLPGTQVQDTSSGDMVLYPVSTGMLLELFPDGNVENEYEISWTTFKAEWALDFADVTYSVGHVDTPKKETNSEFIFDLGYGPLFSGVVFNQPAESTTQELRVVSNSVGSFRWLGGVSFMEADSDSRGWTQTPAFFVSEQVADPIESESMALFGEIEYDLNEQWSVMGGLRYHDEERTNYSEYALGFAGEPTFGPFSMPSPDTSEDSEFSHVSYRVGVTWTPTEDGMVYLTRSTANRAPIILPQSSRIALENANVVPPGDPDASELVNTELGTKWMTLDDRLQLELVYVHSEWNDLPVWAQLNIPPTPVSIAIGGTEAEVEIWELALYMQLSETLSMSYAGAYTDSEITGIPDDASVTGYPAALQVGGELFNYSPVTHNIALNYDRELDNGWGIFAALNYTTRDAPDGVNIFDLSAMEYVPADSDYTNASVNVGARNGPWTFTLSVNNATNHDGMYLPGSQDAVGGVVSLIQQPRSMTLQVTYDQM